MAVAVLNPSVDPARRQRYLLATSGALIVVGLAAGTLASGARMADVLLVAAALVAGADIARRALAGLRRRDVTIELLVTVAAIGALAIGELWEAAAVTFLFTVGAFLEARTLARTRRALGALLGLAPDDATVLRDGRELVVTPFELAVGDLVVVKPGARIPVDGEIVAGSAAVDESSITGEPLPVEREVGDGVFTGTVSYGALRVRATGVGADTTLARIIRRVEAAQEAKAPSQRFIERFARVYTPAMMVLSAATFAVTRDAHLALTLLVISCPGALVIATPVAVVAGIGRAARRGVLLKGGEHLERAAHLSAVVFDKTGTLTTGRPALTDVVPLHPALIDVRGSGGDGVAGADLGGTGLAGASHPGSDPGAVVRWAARAELGSEHPLARPILDASGDARGLPYPERFQNYAGLGVRATVEGREVTVGSLALFAELGLPLNDDVRRTAARLQRKGRTAVAVGLDGVVIGILGIRDTLRDSARPMLAALRALGIRRLAMLTGDAAGTATAIAGEAGLQEVHAELLPEGKLDVIELLQRDGEVVAMVGDGVNDAPALAAADVGVAMGAAGTRVALETAPVALMTDDLGKLVEAVRLARATRRVILQNVAIALVTVVGLLVGVFAGEVHMASGMLVHQASVLVVIANALRLSRA
jgi:Zn2+/Cd2+-exporting ATPase